MFNKYNQDIRKKLEQDTPKTNWKKVLKTHKLMIIRIQHERLIHLLVTMFVGIVMSLFILSTINNKNMLLLAIDVPLFILFSAYILHYRFLENTTQGWYKLEDEVRKKVGKL